MGVFRLFRGLFKVYFISIISDLVTGIWAAGYEGRLKSSTMRKGLWTTVSEITALIIMQLICTVMPEIQTCVDFVVLAMIFKEGVSICENLGRAGMWLPPSLKKTLEAFSENPMSAKDHIKK